MAHLDEARRRAGAAAATRSASPCISARCCGAISVRPTGWISRRSALPSIWSAGWKGYANRSARPSLVSGTLAAETGVPLIPLGTHELRGIASPCAVFTVPES